MKARYTCVVCGRKRTGRFIYFPQAKGRVFITSRGWVCWRKLCNEKEKA